MTDHDLTPAFLANKDLESKHNFHRSAKRDAAEAAGEKYQEPLSKARRLKADEVEDLKPWKAAAREVAAATKAEAAAAKKQANAESRKKKKKEYKKTP